MASSLAFLFPGQGSQSVGMLTALAVAWPVVAETYAEASDVLGYDLWRLVDEGPKSELDRTEVTQPAMLAAGVAVWRVWRSAGGPRPACVAGHSLGEYSALVVAEAIDFRDAVALVAERARAMQSAVPPGEGAMAAIIGLADAEVIDLCARQSRGDVLEAVNFNAPGQVVIAGSKAAVDRAVAAAKPAGAKRALPLPVSVPSHCALMRPAAQGFVGTLASVPVAAPRIPVLHNVTRAPESAPDRIRDLLVRQLFSPVPWVGTMEQLAKQGSVTLAVECGPGKVLTGLSKRMEWAVPTLPVYDPDTLASALEVVNAA